MRQWLTMPMSFYRQLTGLLGLGLITYVLTNTANAYLVNLMGHDAYGDYSICIAVLFSLTPFFALGTTFLLVKELPLLITNKDHQQQNILLKWSFSLILKSAVVAVILLAISYVLQYSLQTHPTCFFQSCSYRHLGRDMLFLVPVVLFLLWNNSLLNATKRSFASRFIGIGATTYLVALMLLLADVFIDNITHPVLLIVLFATFFLLWLLQSIFIYVVMIRSKEFSLADIRQATVPNEKAQQLRAHGLGLMMNQIGYVCLALTNMLLLEAFATDEATVGHYVIIMYIANFSFIASMAMSTILNPHLSGLDDPKRVSGLQRIINIRALLCFVWMLITLVLFILFKPLIFKLYLIDFPNASFAIIFLIIFYYVFGLFGFSEMICLYNNMNKQLYPITGIQIIIQGGIAYWLIPHYAFLGAIFAFAISELVTTTICWVLMKRAKIHIKVLGFL